MKGEAHPWAMATESSCPSIAGWKLGVAWTAGRDGVVLIDLDTFRVRPCSTNPFSWVRATSIPWGPKTKDSVNKGKEVPGRQDRGDRTGAKGRGGRPG